MALKTYKPTSPAVRFKTVSDFSGLSKARPEKSLLVSLKRHAGRNFQGRITMRHRGGGHQRLYRIIDFKRDKTGIPAKVKTIEYDPNRSSRIALLYYSDGEKRYILAPEGIRAGDQVISSQDAEIKPGNCLPLKFIPAGELVHNVELRPGEGGKMARSAGSSVQLLAKEGNYAHLRLPSGEIRMVNVSCRATIGLLSNPDRKNIVIGSAGRSRHLGWRPHVRGTVMNPVDHPHGGGEGKSSPGHVLTTPWGVPTKGLKTRRNKRTEKFIVKRRK